ncbi:MAG TPA: hypothetical protein VGR95_20550 [Thermoanaerobaculia bacterium]|nr:hypothetical protein [Thermoanaerobaculia bacterium]
MKIKNRLVTLWKQMRRERGSALLVSLMVIVGLSMLGLGFVALSETESAISTNERNREEVLSHAEAAANVVVDWFQNPQWALGKQLMPSNDPTVNTELGAMKATRVNNDGTTIYKPLSSQLLFDLPFKPAATDRFFGTPDYPDILINKATAPNFLATFNSKLFNDTIDGGEITEIRIWAPPIVGGSLSGNMYYNDGAARYGVATIKVTAKRYAPGDTNKTSPIATRAVQLVVTEFPFPGPNGPIQSNSAITTNGSFTVFWGQVSAQKPLNLVGKETVPGLPWADAWNRVNWEFGYDSTSPWTPNTTYAVGDIVHASANSRVHDSKLKDWAFQCTTGGTSGATAVSEPSWNSDPTTGPTTFTESTGVIWTRVQPRNWPMYAEDTYANKDAQPWLYQMIGQKYIDPWAEARTRSYFTDASCNTTTCPASYGVTNSGTPTQPRGPYGLNLSDLDPTTLNEPYYSWFQYQTVNSAPPLKIVAFPHIDYDFWKQMAQAGDGQGSVFYFAWDTGSSQYYRLSDSATKKDAAEWMNSCTGVSGQLGPGFYFFDTIGGKNPQNTPNASSYLTNAVDINSQYAKPCYCMKGFMYLNVKQFGSTGVNAGEPNKYYSYPSEPYRDVGYYEVVDDPTDPNYKKAYKTDPNTHRIIPPQKAGNGHWDYQEINNNGVFDIYIANINPKGTLQKPDGTALPNPTWGPIYWYPGCNVVDTTTATVPANPCSEPHEPFLNMLYPRYGSTDAAAAPDPGGNFSNYDCASKPCVTVGWEDPSNQTHRMAKIATDSSMTTPVNCTTNSANCTSNSYDDVGPLAKLPSDPILEGVLYIEGSYQAQGNAEYYGSILVQGDCCGTGTPSVYFDESLLTGDFKKKFPSFPRVYISSYSTE